MKQFPGCGGGGGTGPPPASHATMKPKPKIRVVHVVAPEIIHTDAANFRDLVQRLTGKSATRSGGGGAGKGAAAAGRRGRGEVGPWGAPGFPDVGGAAAVGSPAQLSELEADREELWMGELDGFVEALLGSLPPSSCACVPLSGSGEETTQRLVLSEGGGDSAFRGPLP